MLEKPRTQFEESPDWLQSVIALLEDLEVTEPEPQPEEQKQTLGFI